METPKLLHLSTNDYNLVYEPAEDSFLLLDALEMDFEYLQSLQPLICVELGTGSGVIITALAKSLGNGTKCLAIDINPAACLVAKRTAKENLVSIETLCMDLASCFKGGLIDLIVFNPPYVPTESEEVYKDGLPRAWAGGINGREVIDRLLLNVSRLLSDQGVFYLVLLRENRPDEIEKIIKEHGFEMKIVMERKIRGEHLLITRYNRKPIRDV